jgi:hypothetical protein
MAVAPAAPVPLALSSRLVELSAATMPVHELPLPAVAWCPAVRGWPTTG